MVQVLHHLAVVFQITSEGVRNVTPAQPILSSEFSEQVSLFLSFGEFVKQRHQVASSHSKDVRRRFHQINGDCSAAMLAQIKPTLAGQSHAVSTGRLPRKSTCARTREDEVLSSTDEITKNHLRQRAAAGVSGADKKDVFQSAKECPGSSLCQKRSANARKDISCQDRGFPCVAFRSFLTDLHAFFSSL